jgi:23S rRNA pseudouridine2605 synthase
MDRLQKVLARGGVASRRAAEKLIAGGRVRVNGRVVQELGTKVDPRKDVVEVDGKRVVAEHYVYLVLHKPKGVVSTMSDPEGRPSVKELVGGVGARVFPIGRLDFHTSGVLLLTNDGAFADGLLHPRRAVPKTYVVKVAGKMEEADLDRWRKGIDLEDGRTLPAQVSLLRYEEGGGEGPRSRVKTWMQVTLREGRNQQIRRMGEATGFPVMRLARISFAGITGEGLRPGAWRALTTKELVQLKKDYGVPTVVPHDAGAETERGARKESRRAAAKRGGFRDDRGAGPAGRGAAGRGAAPKGARRERSRGGGARGTEGARYGGGAPVRRSADTRADWGGGIERGGRRLDEETEPSLGRGGRSRTTGTGGGIGAGAGSYRISKTRRG